MCFCVTDTQKIIPPVKGSSKLIIFSIGGVLCTETNLKDKDNTLFFIHPRKHLQIFLKKIFALYDVAIWESHSYDGITQTLRRIMTKDQMTNLKFVFSQTEEAKYKKITRTYYDISLKRLSRVWEEFPQYNSSNTILIDPLSYKAAQNPTYTSLHPPSISKQIHEDIFLMKILYPVLLDMAKAKHVRLYLQENSPKWSLDTCYDFIQNSPIFADLVRRKLVKCLDWKLCLPSRTLEILDITTSELSYVQKLAIQTYHEGKDLSEGEIRELAEKIADAEYRYWSLSKIQDFLGEILQRHRSILGKSLVECTKYVNLAHVFRTCTNLHCHICPKYCKMI